MLTSPSLTAADTDFIQCFHVDTAALRAGLMAGLEQAQASIPPKYLYDTLGSKLFEAICELPEYYLTRTESTIMDTHMAEMVGALGMDATLIDLGAGNCAKASRLFPLLQPLHYVPVDISVEFLRDAMGQLRQRFPHIAMTGVGLDFSAGMQLPAQIRHRHRRFFYPGSSIGNFTPAEAAVFLRGIRAACEHEGRIDGGLLIGVDLVKNRATLEAAYDDALGVTAAFNLNMLLHLNILLGSNFRVCDWQHRAFFNAEESRMEMHLEARHALTVMWAEGERQFAAGERIHTENSYKYTPQDFLALLDSAGFGQASTWTDAARQFMVCYARAI
jgi:dimethylhistidine N-methyltransferase